MGKLWEQAPIEDRQYMLSIRFASDASCKKHATDSWKELPDGFKRMLLKESAEIFYDYIKQRRKQK
jgi:hypothetical protein